MEVRHLTEDISHCPDREQILGVLMELRGQYENTQALQRQIAQQQSADGYQIAYVVDEDNVICVAGFVINHKLAWGKHIYVDDLISSERHRSRGAGKLLVDWLRAYGRDGGCRELHLDSGVQRFAAHRFYLREGFRISSHHFSIEDLINPREA